MARFGSIDRMPEAIRDTIKRLRQDGRTIDEILAHLRAMEMPLPSRSALGRHVKGLEKVGERMRRSRDVARGLAAELGDLPESHAARVNIELLHSAVLDLFMRADEGETVDADGAAALAGNPEGTMLLAKAVDHLTRASHSNEKFTRENERRVQEKTKALAAKAAEGEAIRHGLSAETIAAIKSAIFGVQAAA